MIRQNKIRWNRPLTISFVAIVVTGWTSNILGGPLMRIVRKTPLYGLRGIISEKRMSTTPAPKTLDMIRTRRMNLILS